MSTQLADFVAEDTPPPSMAPKTFAEAVARRRGDGLTAEEERELAETSSNLQESTEEVEGDDEELPEPEQEKDETAVPEWVVMPSDGRFKIPQGRQVYFLMFRAKWTDTPQKGDRQCIMWSLSSADEKLALKRTRGDSTRMLAELSKQMIRAIDGKTTDWTLGHGAPIEKWWNDIGSKCRQMVQAVYHKSHSLSAEEQADFFVNCMAVRSAT